MFNKKGSPNIDFTLKKLTDSAQQVAHGNYNAANDLFQVAASDAETPELRNLAETMGFMSVKIEGREFHLEQVLEELKKKNVELEENIALRAENGFFFCSIIFFLCIYTIVLYGILIAGCNSSTAETALTIVLIVTLLTIAGISNKRHPHPWAVWGLTWKGSRRAIWESLLFSIPIAIVGIILKAILVYSPSLPLFGQPIFEGFPSMWVVLFYSIGAIAQEIISRGFIQTSIERLLTGKYRIVTAITTTSLLFAVAHLHYTIPTMLVTFLGGFFFGWLFYRQRTLVGISIAHALLGVLYLDILKLIG